MTKITKEEMLVLIKNGYLRCVKGKYLDLIVCSKRKKHGGKTHYVTDFIAHKLKYCGLDERSN